MNEAPPSAKTSGRISNSATASTAPELNPSRKCSRSRNLTAAIPPTQVEPKLTQARSIGMKRMRGQLFGLRVARARKLPSRALALVRFITEKPSDHRAELVLTLSYRIERLALCAEPSVDVKRRS